MQEKVHVLGKLGYIIESEVKSHEVNYTVYKIRGFDANINKVIESERYLTAKIRGSGCSDFNFKNDSTGSFNICGYEQYKSHLRLIEILYSMTREYLNGGEFGELEEWDWQEIKEYEGIE